MFKYLTTLGAPIASRVSIRHRVCNVTDSERDLAGTGKHLSTTELRLWTSFLDASRIIESELDHQLRNECEMTHREYEVLVRVDGAGGHMRLRSLAQQIEASPQLVTQTVDRLVNRGWIRRQPSAEDKRGVEASLTALGRKNLASASLPHAELLRQLLLRMLDTEQLDSVATSLGGVADHLRTHRRGGVCGDANCPLT